MTDLARLIAAEKRQRAETKRRGLKAEAVDVVALFEAQGGNCGCGCGYPLDVASAWDAQRPPPGYAVIGHSLARASRGEHTVENVSLWRHACNRLAGHRETGEAASVKRFTPVKGRPKKGSIPQRKDGGWPAKGSQKIKSRNDLRRKP